MTAAPPRDGIEHKSGDHGGPSCRYVLHFAEAAQHLVDVELHLRLPEGFSGPLQLSMPAWAPGSYLVRDYARHVEGVQAQNTDPAAHGEKLAVHKVRKDCWEVRHASSRQVLLRYRLYARELTVRTNFVNADVALVQGAASYLGCPQLEALPHELEVHLPPGWGEAVCGLRGQRDGQRVRFVADNYDALVDSPLLCGNPRSHTFEAGGVHHVLATVGGETIFDDAAAVAEWRRITAEMHALWREVPYDRYAMLNVLLGGQGGLEHRHGALVMANPTARHGAGRSEYLGLLCHEMFHAWNVKRLRPRALGPFAYGTENYTPSLWVAEGLTAYYDDLLVRRAGLSDDATYLSKLAQTLGVLARTPGKDAQSLTEASFDAWIKLYRPDENTGNTTVSYYLKGSLVGLVLDARLRAASGGTRSLDDVMRLAYRRHSGERGYSEEEFRAVIAEVAGQNEAGYLHGLLDVPGPIDVTPALQTFGLRLRWRSTPQAPLAAPPAVTLWGIACEEGGGRLTVARVRRDCPAYTAGLNVGDELLAVDDWRLPAGRGWLEAGGQLAGAPAANLLVSRFGRLRRIAVPLSAPPAEEAVLELDPAANPAQCAARAAWLRSGATPAP